MKQQSIFQLAVKNIRRTFSRTLLLLLVIALASGMLFGLTVLFSGIGHALDKGIKRLGADIIVVPERNEFEAKAAILSGQPAQFSMDRAVTAKVKALPEIKTASPQIFMKPTSFSCCYNKDTFLIAFDPATDFTITPWIKGAINRLPKKNEIISGSELPLFEGATIPFFGTRFSVIATLDQTGMNFFDQSVFMSLEAAYAMADASKTESQKPLDLDRNSISAVLVQVQDNASIEKTSIRIEHLISGVRAIPAQDVTSSVKKQMKGIVRLVAGLGVLLWLFAFSMIGFAYSMIVNERQKEIGLLRAMGAKKRDIFFLIESEVLIMSSAGSLLGIVVGSLLLWLMKGILSQNLNLPYLLPSSPTFLILGTGTVLLSLLAGLISALIPARRASSIEPLEGIRKGN